MQPERVQQLQSAINTLRAEGKNISTKTLHAHMGGSYPRLVADLRELRMQRADVSPASPGAPVAPEYFPDRAKRDEHAASFPDAPSSPPVAALRTQPPRTRLPLPSADEIARRRALYGIEVQACIACLELCAQGRLYPYGIVNKTVGFNVQEKRPQANLRTARQFMLWAYHRCFDLITDQGIMWVTEGGKLVVAARERAIAHNKLRKNVQLNGSVDVEVLSSDNRLAWVAAVNIDSAAAIATHEKTVEQVITQKELHIIQIDLRAYADLFQGLLPSGNTTARKPLDNDTGRQGQ